MLTFVYFLHFLYEKMPSCFMRLAFDNFTMKFMSKAAWGCYRISISNAKGMVCVGKTRPKGTATFWDVGLFEHVSR